ncbi:MAG: mannose-1-phosphate guanylyltransferase/mannose-6-phosphate isomerase [Oleispira sp.]|nr:mannose-1-phosphate guanylyltransferase/mannose-6-phosphate isomerase [Oleispira sp.]
MIIPVIMAGGSGTRLWPLSRTAFPKQFIALTSTLTMLQETAARINGLSTAAPVVICNEEHRFLVAEQMRQQNLQPSILLEPVGRNTAPAIALAAIKAVGDDKEAVLLVLAADHVIEDISAFQQCVNTLLPEVQAGKFGTLGIVPTDAATGYGYIKASGQGDLKTVSQFVEKPDAETAAQYVADGYLWNSGMFLIRADRYLQELKNFRTDIYDACIKSMAATQQDLDFVRVDVEAFSACPDESVDYAVMEPLAAKGEVVVAPLDAGWSDVGSWSALWDIAEKDDQGNVTVGQGEENFILQGSQNCYVYGSANTEGSGRLIATLGVENLVIVDTPDALLVANKDKVQDIKKIVAKIKESGRTLHYQHRQVYRPWGVYDSIDNGERYQVKRITVKPGAKLSVQMHHHRAEHWVVVSGTAKVTNGDKTFLVTENESTYIPIGQVHALENPGVLPLEMIEVQSGSYLGEDDIVRFEDKYGRC